VQLVNLGRLLKENQRSAFEKVDNIPLICTLISMGEEYKFDWRQKKRTSNLKKHGLDFEDAKPLFNDALMVVEDDRKDYGETRYVGFGELEDILMVVVFTTIDPNVIHIISFRPAEDDEKEFYYGK
jgi:hypothetical protein